MHHITRNIRKHSNYPVIAFLRNVATQWGIKRCKAATTLRSAYYDLAVDLAAVTYPSNEDSATRRMAIELIDMLESAFKDMFRIHDAVEFADKLVESGNFLNIEVIGGEPQCRIALTEGRSKKMMVSEQSAVGSDLWNIGLSLKNVEKMFKEYKQAREAIPLAAMTPVGIEDIPYNEAPATERVTLEVASVFLRSHADLSSDFHVSETANKAAVEKIYSLLCGLASVAHAASVKNVRVPAVGTKVWSLLDRSTATFEGFDLNYGSVVLKDGDRTLGVGYPTFFNVYSWDESVIPEFHEVHNQVFAQRINPLASFFKAKAQQ